MYFKRESERQDQEPHCKPKESEEQNLNWTQKKVQDEHKENKNRKPEKSWLQNGSWKKHEDVMDLFTVPSAILDMQPRTRENEAGVDLR